jgi:hypothetical protein
VPGSIGPEDVRRRAASSGLGLLAGENFALVGDSISTLGSVRGRDRTCLRAFGLGVPSIGSAEALSVVWWKDALEPLSFVLDDVVSGVRFRFDGLVGEKLIDEEPLEKPFLCVRQ